MRIQIAQMPDKSWFASGVITTITIITKGCDIKGTIDLEPSILTEPWLTTLNKVSKGTDKTMSPTILVHIPIISQRSSTMLTVRFTTAITFSTGIRERQTTELI